MWLQERLDERGWRQADLVNYSEGSIKRDRVSKWINGKEKPSYRYAVIVANTLGVDQSGALEVAGFVESDEQRRERQVKLEAAGLSQEAIPSPELRAELRKFDDATLLGELLVRTKLREVAESNVSSTSDAEVTDETPNEEELVKALRGEATDYALAASDRPDIEGEQEHYEEQQ